MNLGPGAKAMRYAIEAESPLDLTCRFLGEEQSPAEAALAADREVLAKVQDLYQRALRAYTTEEVAAAVDKSPRTVRRSCNRLLDNGLLDAMNRGRQRAWLPMNPDGTRPSRPNPARPDAEST
jgi:DNA-binding transcriptional ArsR family regulator